MVSFYRGPWQQVIRDRPNAVFADSPVAVDNVFPTATAFETHISRDRDSVGQYGAPKANMERILHDAASHRRRKYEAWVLRPQHHNWMPPSEFVLASTILTRAISPTAAVPS